MLKLPPELVSKVFVHCLPSRNADRLSPSEAPVLLTSVSSAWRLLALSEPFLWDTVVFPAPDLPISEAGDNEEPPWLSFIESNGIERWFDRAGHARLLSLAVEAHYAQKTPSCMARIREVIIKYGQERFRRLELVFGEPLDHQPAFFPLHPERYDTFSALESLTLAYRHSLLQILASQVHPQDPNSHQTPFSIAPNLRHVKLIYNYQRDGDLERLLQPWTHHLRELEAHSFDGIANMFMPEWVGVFRVCPNLAKATLTAPYNTWEAPLDASSGSENAVASHLTSLTIRIEHQGGYTNWKFLKGPVTFPNLRHLHIHFHLWYESLMPGDLFRSIKAMGKTLETLKFSIQESRHVFVPLDSTAVVKAMIREPGAYPKLRQFSFPYRNSALVEDIGLLLRLHEPKGKYRGMAVEVTVVLMDEGEVYDAGLENDPVLSSRFKLRCLVGAC